MYSSGRPYTSTCSRSVEAGEKLGFLPGDFKEKVDPYLRPLYDALGESLDDATVGKYLERGVIEVAPLAYISKARGQRLREIAVRVLAQHSRPGQAVHYKQWYALLREAGYTVGGKDPLATFLATVSRSPQIEGVGQRSGLYVLKGGLDAADERAMGASGAYARAPV